MMSSGWESIGGETQVGWSGRSASSDHTQGGWSGRSASTNRGGEFDYWAAVLTGLMFFSLVLWIDVSIRMDTVTAVLMIVGLTFMVASLWASVRPSMVADVYYYLTRRTPLIGEAMLTVHPRSL